MSVNRVILVGRLGKDPESRAFPDGGSVCNFSIATSESWKDKQTGERKERTEWHNIVLRNRLGEVAMQYLKKGSQVYIEGSIRTRKWQDQSGQDRYTTEVMGREMTMLDSKPENKAIEQLRSEVPTTATPSAVNDYGRQGADLDDDFPF